MSMNAPSIGVNLRVTGHCNQGGRKYMEDTFAVAYQQTDDENDLEYAYFGIFDGHGGRDAAIFAKEHLMNAIVSQKSFWSDNDENVLKSIKEGFVATHMAMWKEVGKWPQTISGLPSTSGTTASVVFIRNGKLYVGHVGDSAIVLGYKDPETKHYAARSLTSDHKPELPAERKRIEDGGGSVMSKCGVQRVVWNRPRIGHKGPIRRSTHIDQIPFLAVARSLGDLWSYDYLHSQFNVSPEPDVCVVPLNIKTDRCIVVATDGVWNMINAKDAVRYVEAAERENERHFLANDSIPIGSQPLINPSRLLVDKALSHWFLRKKRADNATVLTIMLDPPGPPRSEVLLRKRMLFKLRPREELVVDHSCNSMDVLNTSAPDIQSLDSSLEGERQHASSSQMSTAETRARDDRETRAVIASDYDIWMNGSLSLQRSGGYKLMPDIGAEDRNQEDMWRLAPTPPLPEEPQNKLQDVNFSYKPQFPFIRTQTVFIKPPHLQLQNTIKAENLVSSHNLQLATSSTISSYMDSTPPSFLSPPPSEINQTVANLRTANILPSVDHQIKAKVATQNRSTKVISTPPLTSSNPNARVKNGKRVSSTKRKSVPGKRELFYLLAKPSRFCRNHISSSSFIRQTRTRHITRSRLRLHKVY